MSLRILNFEGASRPAEIRGGNVSGKQETRLEQALALHGAGEFDRAARFYRSILAVEPTHFAAAHMLGALLLQQGAYDAAQRQLRRASQINPYSPETLNHLGMALRHLDWLDDALAAYDRAVALRPNYAEAYCNRGNVLRLLKRFDAALASYDRAIALKPHYADAYHNRGALLEALDRWDDAAASYENAIALRPDFPEALNNLGNVSRVLCRYDEALAAYDRAIALVPDYAGALTNRGNVLRDMHRYAEALESHERALALEPGLAEIYNNRGSVYRDISRFDDAMRDYRDALSLAPGHIEARWSLGLTQLLLGDWEQGWENYELRFGKRYNASRRPDNPAPEWLGEPLAGRRILLYGEQGNGDVIQFVRYAAALEAQGAEVTVLTHRRLHRLLSSVGATVKFASAVTPEQPFDFQIALMSIPRILTLRPGNVVARTPYLAADPRRVDIWRARLGGHGFKVGLCWQGNPAGSIDNGRSLPLREFAPLATIDRVRLVSLQKNHGVEQIDKRPAGMILETPGHDFDDGADAFVDTAAMMANLDLVVTSDTSIAHLAGALGRPVWIVLKHVPDWRWLLGRADSPWYPNARLFRQHAVDDWASAVRDVAAALGARVGAASADGDISSVA
jgi:tetratricopeptide (TPR) repeat protein